MGLVRSGLGHGLLAATTLALGCAAPVESDDWEPVDESSQALTKTLKATLVKKWTNAKKWRGTKPKSAKVVCTDQPFKMAYMFKNAGTAIWRDVPSTGETRGSDVLLVSRNGGVDPLTQRAFFSIRGNDNSYVRGDRKAKNCAHDKGCRRTIFNADSIWMLAPNEPGIYKTSWRMRDFSKVHGEESQAFGPKVGYRFAVVSCEDGNCGCRAWCTNGEKYEPVAGPDSCLGLSQVSCEQAGATLLRSHYIPCYNDIGGGTGGSGSGGSGSGGSGSGGSSGGWGGSGTGGSSGGTEPVGGPDGYTCGTEQCQLPDVIQDVASPCCYGGDTCGYEWGGVCDALGPPPDLEGGDDPDLDELDLNPPPEPDYHDPVLPEDDGAGVTAKDGGCTLGGTRGRAGAWSLLALAGVTIALRRRRRA